MEKTDCKAHPGNSKVRITSGCIALNTLLCATKDCPFYKPQEQYDKQIARSRAGGHSVEDLFYKGRTTP
jgi:hypothetical protein